MSLHFGLFGHFVDQGLSERVVELHPHPMFPVEQYKFMRTVIAKVTVHPDKVAIEYDTHGLEHVIAETKEVSA